MADGPAVDEFELTLLGPGRGESVVAHVGDGQWLIVDCCVQKSGGAAPLDYLASIGVDSSAVRWLVASHWHDDHVRGFSGLVERCGQADVFASTALELDEFLILAAAEPDRQFRGPSGVSEMATTIDLLRERGTRLSVVGADTRLHLRMATEDLATFELWSLSPSAADRLDALTQFSEYALKVGDPKLAIPRPPRNPASVVLFAQFGSATALLAGDLEASNDDARGWQAIVASPGRPKQRSEFLKVPHHGSEDAHDPAMWDHLLVTSPPAMVAPMRQGNVDLPRQTDIERLLDCTDRAWVTHDRTVGQSAPRPNAVVKTIRESTRDFVSLQTTPGRVTLRCPSHDPSNVTVDAPLPARRL